MAKIKYATAKEKTKARRRRGVSPRSLYAAGLTEEQAKARGVPLYYSEEWLRRKKAEYGTFTAILQAHPELGCTKNTLSYAAKQFGWEPEKPVRAPELREEARADYEAGLTLKQVAEKYGISLGTAHNWVKK